MKPKGYLVFTTHDGDEMDATFVPKEETDVIDLLNRHVAGDISHDEVMVRFSRWRNGDGDELLEWNTQTRCRTLWPFNDVEILGTYYHMVY
jgi:hypothetical protein